MIKGITRIKGIGVFENYTKPVDTKEFALKNLIYGWNYSGKTTLSRLFALLETKTPNSDLGSCNFCFETDGQHITEKTYQQCSVTVRVFNSDFIHDNLHFDGEGFNPILLLGKDAGEAQSRIDKLSERNKRSVGVQNKIIIQSKRIDTAIGNAKTEAARYIRQLLKIDPYTATHLSNDVLGVGLLDSQLLSEKSLSECHELALTPDNKKPSTIDELILPTSIEPLYKEVISLLAETPSFSNTMKHLEDNPVIETWVENGLHIHPKAGKCEFCGNVVSDEQLVTFRAHFSKDLAEHKQKIERLLKRVRDAELEFTQPKEAEFNPQFRDTYLEVAEPLAGAIKAFNHAVKTLAKDVQRKVIDSRKAMQPEPLAEGLTKSVTDIVEAINTVIKSNNELASNFKTAKVEARNKVKNHYVQQFINTQEATGYERQIKQLIKRHARLKTYSLSLQTEIKKLLTLISKAQRGREKINERLASMLGGEAVRIEVFNDSVTNQERFRLVRKNNRPARNLSDGERTAIAFSYFLTKLQELKAQEFNNTIVYIDDPVSSLDANHVFQVNAAIKEVFFGKDQNGEWTTKCKQFFLSTHNFQFFDLIRELKPTNNKKARLYFLRKVATDKSILGDMPTSLSDYSSEYHFLFETILKFRESDDKPAYEGLMLLPNAVRRFVELYTYARMPTARGMSVDQRAEAIFHPETSKRILKILHYFSHGNNMDRLTGNNELIFDLEHAVEIMLNEIEEENPIHWGALMAST